MSSNFQNDLFEKMHILGWGWGNSQGKAHRWQLFTFQENKVKSVWADGVSKVGDCGRRGQRDDGGAHTGPCGSGWQS